MVKRFVLVTNTVVDGMILGEVEEREDGEVIPVLYVSEEEAIAEIADMNEEYERQVEAGDRAPEDGPAKDDFWVEPVEVLEDGSIRLLNHDIVWTIDQIRAQRGEHA